MTFFGRRSKEFRKIVKVHELEGGTLRATDNGIEARCVCGWSSGFRISSMVASAIFREHQEDPYQ